MALLCDSAAGCREPLRSEMPHCAEFVPLVVANASSAYLLDRDRAVASQYLDKLRAGRGWIPDKCRASLRSFICLMAFEGCALGRQIPPCRSVCEAWVSDCPRLVRKGVELAAPAKERHRLRCREYEEGTWPGCSETAEFARSSEVAYFSESPCGVCWKGEASFTPLPSDRCAVCNGDNRSCAGCDGSGAAYDACGECGGQAVACRALQSDPRVLGYLAMASVLAVGATVGYSLLRPLGVPSLRSPHCFLGCPGHAMTSRTGGGRAQAEFFASLGCRIARHPWRVLAGMSLLAAAAGSGLFRLRANLDPFTAWLPDNSQASVRALQWQELTGKPHVRFSYVLLASRSLDGADARSGLEQALELHTSLARMRVVLEQGGDRSTYSLHGEDGGGDETPPDAAGRCAGGCKVAALAGEVGVVSPLRLWDSDRQRLAEDPAPGETLSGALREGGLGAAALRGQVVLSGGARGGDDPKLKALMMVYLLDGGLEQRPAVVAWERAAAELLVDPGLPLWSAHLFSPQSLADDILQAATGDEALIGSSYVLMFAYVSFFIGRGRGTGFCHRGLLALAALLSVALATLAAFGLCSAAGVLYSDVDNLAIFVLVGIGVDGSFVLVRALDGVAEMLPDASPQAADGDAAARADLAARRVGEALGSCGPTILMSSATNAVALALGAASPLPALRSFCLYCSACVVSDLLFQCTFFVAALSVGEARLVDGPLSRPRCGSDAVPPRGAPACAPAGHRLLASPACRAVVACAYAVTLTASALASSWLPVGLDVAELAPKSSQTAEFFRQRGALFTSKRQLVEVIVQHQPVVDTLAVSPLASSAVRENIFRLHQAINATHFVSSATGGMEPLWLSFFAEHLRRMALPGMAEWGSTHVAALGAFLGTNASLGVLIGNGSLVATRMRFLADNYDSSAMLALRATIAASGLGRSAFSYTPEDIFLEQDARMMRFTLSSLLYTVASVFVVVNVLSMSFKFTVLMSVCVLSSCTHMLGWMVLTGTSLSAISLIPLMMSVGLCIDYSTHIGHAALDSRGGAWSDRAAEAIRARGAAVAHGGTTTAISQLLLAFSSSCIFMTFFKMMMGVVAVGLFHALLVLPVLLGSVPAAAREPAAARRPAPCRGAAARDGVVVGALSAEERGGADDRGEGVGAAEAAGVGAAEAAGAGGGAPR